MQDKYKQCPFCGETINAGAKKCKYCLEWLDKDNNDNDNNEISAENEESQGFNIVPVILGFGILLMLLFLVWKYFIFIPNCADEEILSELQNNIKNKYVNLHSLTLYNSTAKNLSKQDKGYICRIDTLADDVNLSVEYNYKKTFFNNYIMDVKLLLPDCYNQSVKDTLSSLVLSSDYLDFNEKAASANVELATVEKYDKVMPKYYCKANLSVSAKPGQAFLYYYDETDKLKCKVKYQSFFCENGYTSCVSVESIDNCDVVKE